MTTREIIKSHREICDNATSSRLYDALSGIETLLKEINVDAFQAESENIVSNYQNLLSYTIRGVTDPQRPQVLSSLIISVVELADRIKEHFLEKNNLLLLQNKRNSYNKLSLIQAKQNEALESRKYMEKISDLLNETRIAFDDDEAEKKQQDFRNDLFDYILYTDKFSDSDMLFVKTIFDSGYFKWYDNCLPVTAVTLSMIRFFDTSKMELLFDFYYSGRHEVRQRALVGILLCFYVFDDRIRFYKALNDRINKIYAENEISESDVMFIIKQFVKAKDTERITRKMHEEIIPDIQKLAPRLEDKLDLKNILSDDPSIEKNPDWQSILEDSPELFSKIEELSKMQLEGNDVFMSTFALLKHFDFFNNMSNWFLPFYQEHHDVQKIINEEETYDAKGFLGLLERSAYMCNSDKFSFILNLKMMPVQQKTMLLNLFNSELENMNELADEDQMLNSAIKNNTVFTQYIQDLYRFFKLHRTRNHFDDIFDLKLDFYNKSFINTIFRDVSFKKKIADYYFTTDHYAEALDVFLNILKQAKQEMDILQKTGYCYQRMGDHGKALEYYLKAELYDSSNVWLLKKIALCYSNIKDYQKSLEYYLELEKLEQDNMNIVMNTANCYLNLKDYRKALHYYYKIEFNFTENAKIYRPIAWCLFVSGDFLKSEEYFRKLIDKGMSNKYDYMNYGHVKWVTGDRLTASDLYYQSITQPDNDFDNFNRGFNEDVSLLMKYGIQPEEIPLMLDHLLFKLKSHI
ncbi:MAG TPA: tetratricopeptide repeat protein [Bacteroidales bacterium]|nr:tetratricopeptide repeat protein [Bacteroidales bacterium]